MFKFGLCLILFTLILCTCEESQKEDKNKQSTWEDFRDFLTVDTDYHAIVARFGPPDRDVGSGIHIYVYDLCDNTEIWIGYVTRIMYARHVDKNRNILHTII